ncbi:MAG: hypothetical protein LBU29_00410 [Endomicrobium sp.]|jgi:hypothetical protein|nr:hypothetical protein [Endomicrobium sp.]
MITVSTIKIPYDKLLIRLGYWQTKTKLNKKTDESIKEILDLAQKLIKPKIVTAFENTIVNEQEILFNNGYKIKSASVASLLRNSFRAYGVGITIGNTLEDKRAESLRKGEIFSALILDAAGSVAAEETMILVNAQIKIYEEKNGNKLTKRYSPGYGDWVLEDNRQFLSWLGAERIGIKLNEFCQMIPEKSISALIGVEKLENKKERICG